MKELGTELISQTITEFIKNLDYEYMLIVILVSYGLYFSENFNWINWFFSPVRKKGRTKGVWLIGTVLAILEIIRYIPILFADPIRYYQQLIYIIYSFIVVQVFLDDLVLLLNKWLVVLGFKIVKKKNKEDEK
jgi:hypothetical protein